LSSVRNRASSSRTPRNWLADRDQANRHFHLPNFPALFFADDQVGFLALRNRLYPSDFLACACKRAAAERARNGLVGLSSRSSIQPPRLRRFVAGIDECECPQPRKLVADAAHLGVNFSDHVLELIGHFIPLALRLGKPMR
jgi:hypothetical protein